MEPNKRNHKVLRQARFLMEFWEAWLLALFLVTILGFFGKTTPRPLFTQNTYGSQLGSADIIQSEGLPLESGF
jgi:hypothetical protein